MSTPTHISRRTFLATGLATLATPSFHGEVTSSDPRLTARPHRPDLIPSFGANPIVDAPDRRGLLYVPTTYTLEVAAPLIVALHGAGGHAASWDRLYDACEARGIVLMAPDSRARTWDRVQGAFGPDVRHIDAALGHTFDRCAIASDRIALVGFSDGASYALSLGPSNGDLFTHLIAFSPGFSDPSEPIVGRPRVFISHGYSDRVLPVAGSRTGIVPMFEMDGYGIDYVEFEGGHEIPPEIAAQALDWFLTAPRPDPRTIR